MPLSPETLDFGQTCPVTGSVLFRPKMVLDLEQGCAIDWKKILFAPLESKERLLNYDEIVREALGFLPKHLELWGAAVWSAYFHELRHSMQVLGTFRGVASFINALQHAGSVHAYISIASHQQEKSEFPRLKLPLTEDWIRAHPLNSFLDQQMVEALRWIRSHHADAQRQSGDLLLSADDVMEIDALILQVSACQEVGVGTGSFDFLINREELGRYAALLRSIFALFEARGFAFTECPTVVTTFCWAALMRPLFRSGKRAAEGDVFSTLLTTFLAHPRDKWNKEKLYRFVDETLGKYGCYGIAESGKRTAKEFENVVRNFSDVWSQAGPWSGRAGDPKLAAEIAMKRVNYFTALSDPSNTEFDACRIPCQSFWLLAIFPAVHPVILQLHQGEEPAFKTLFTSQRRYYDTLMQIACDYQILGLLSGTTPCGAAFPGNPEISVSEVLYDRVAFDFLADPVYPRPRNDSSADLVILRQKLERLKADDLAQGKDIEKPVDSVAALSCRCGKSTYVSWLSYPRIREIAFRQACSGCGLSLQKAILTTESPGLAMQFKECLKRILRKLQ